MAPKGSGSENMSFLRMLKPADGLLLGADLKKDRRELLLAYDDPAGVTAAFNKNILARINRELGGSFDVKNFEHVVEYEEEGGGLHSYLAAASEQNVNIGEIGLQLHFEPGDRIHTESAYKYSPESIAQMASSESSVSFRAIIRPGP